MIQETFLMYCNSIFKRTRLKTKEVQIGSVKIGGDNPIAVQSMTTKDTMDTEATVNESISMIKSGCEIVRLTAPSIKEAINLKQIKSQIKKRGYNTPLVADIHFTPNAAIEAAKHVEKVRINPGNYADKKKFENIDYTDESYKNELKRIEEKFTPLVKTCKENSVAIRIGVNHGSLSDRILSRYGDTPEGMVASAIEFVEICKKNKFYNLVISIKASNTIVMVQAYRLLAAEMQKSGDVFPIHLGVTEAGEGEDGRLKSAIGIGALLEDGIGDTIRVSLTEKPESEIPVARKLLEKYSTLDRKKHTINLKSIKPFYNPYSYTRRKTNKNLKVGGTNVPVVFADLSKVETIKPSHLFSFGYNYSIELDKWNITDTAADYLYIGQNEISFPLPGTITVLVDFNKWKKTKNTDYQPVINKKDLQLLHVEQYAFIRHDVTDLNLDYLDKYPKLSVIVESNYANTTQLLRAFYAKLNEKKIHNPVIFAHDIDLKDTEKWQLWSAAELGSLFIDGFGDGIWLKSNQPRQILNSTSFGILQGTRTRITKTEYISCPSCGRTLFDLQETTAKIREKTSHLKGIKIGVMGCIVNGPGEMADADYGYVGVGPGKIHLYKEKNVVRKNIKENEAVEELINLIKENGDWVENVKND